MRKTPSGTVSRTWALHVYTKGDGKRQTLGLGSTAHVSLVQARIAARDIRSRISAGQTPRPVPAPRVASFREIAEELLLTREGKGRSRKHRSQWRVTLEAVYPTLGREPVDAVTPSLVAETLRPIWRKTPETARRTLQRIGSVLRLATAKGLYHRPDPLPAARLILGHQGDRGATSRPWATAKCLPS